jgi:hypothetical protein
MFIVRSYTYGIRSRTKIGYFVMHGTENIKSATTVQTNKDTNMLLSSLTGQ